MPRYFISTSDHIRVTDEEGIVLPDRQALRSLLRESLVAILHDEGLATGVDEITAEVRDEDGKVVMRAKAIFVAADE